MTDSNILKFPSRPACGHRWCVNSEIGHEQHFGAPEGPRTYDEDGDVVDATFARIHRFAGRMNFVQLGLWEIDEGGRTTLLNADEAEELAAALTRLAAECRRPDPQP